MILLKASQVKKNKTKQNKKQKQKQKKKQTKQNQRTSPISISTTTKTLDGIMITIKLTEDVPDQGNAQRVIDARHEYTGWF